MNKSRAKLALSKPFVIIVVIAIAISAAFGLMAYYEYVQEQKSYGGECQHPNKWINDVDPKYCDL